MADELQKLVRQDDPGINIPASMPYPFFRGGPQGDLVANLHGEFYESTRNGAMFYAATQGTGKITTVDLAATYTGLCLSNPAGNTKKLILRAVGVTIHVAGAALIGVHLSGGYSAAGVTAHTGALAFGTAFASLELGGSDAPTALVDDAATIVNPRHIMALGIVGATPGSQPSMFMNTQGAPVILPGGYVCITTTIITGAAGLFGSFWWEEVPNP